MSPTVVTIFSALLGCSLQVQEDAGSDYRQAADYSKMHKGLSFLVVEGDEIVFEEYHNGHKAARPWGLHSATKSFWGVVAVAAAEDGLLSLDEKVCQTITEWQLDRRKRKITIRQLLNFTSGIDPGTDAFGLGKRTTNFFEHALNFSATSEPGQHFAYGPSHLTIFGEVLRRKLEDGGESPLDYLKRRIFDPIGLKVARWQRGPAGNPTMPYGAHLTAREWIKFGMLIKDNGRWKGKQIVSAALLAECFEGSEANPNYGLTFWLEHVPDKPDPQIIKIAGYGNQLMLIIPSHDLIILRQGRAEKDFSSSLIEHSLRGQKNRRLDSVAE